MKVNLHLFLSIILSTAFLAGVFAIPVMAASPPAGVFSTNVSGEGYVTAIDESPEIYSSQAFDAPIDVDSPAVWQTEPFDIAISEETPIVWQSETFTVTVKVGDYADTDPGPKSSTYSVRLLDTDQEEFSPVMDEAIDQQQVELEELETETIDFEVPADHFEDDGQKTLFVNLYDLEPGQDTKVNGTALPIIVVRQNRDFDNDKILNVYEADGPSSMIHPDTDRDGILDGVEVHQFDTDPTDSDTDGDGLSDLEEIRTWDTDPNNVDTDGDSLGDFEEAKELETSPVKADTDGDGLSDSAELNKYGTDPLKADTDGDRLSDWEEVRVYGMDPLSTDTDNDGVSDALEDKVRHDESGTENDRDTSQNESAEQNGANESADQVEAIESAAASQFESRVDESTPGQPGTTSAKSTPSESAASHSPTEDFEATSASQPTPEDSTNLVSATLMSVGLFPKLSAVFVTIVLVVASYRWARWP